MCLSTVYSGTVMNADSMLSEYVTEVSVDADKISLTDITGNVTNITGSLRKVDLIKNIIIVDVN